MADYITLMGAEQVANAAHTVRSAADEMSRAASNLDGSLMQHQRFLDDWLMRSQQILEAAQHPAGQHGEKESK